MQAKIEQFARRAIEIHGFGSNTLEGFSCFIPDSPPFPSDEGLLLWNFSRTYNRFETQVQKFHAKARIRRMERMLGLPYDEYQRLFVDFVRSYLTSLTGIGNFADIGGGVTLFGQYRVKNVAADFSSFNAPETLRQFELITINNPIVHFAEQHGYFECLNKDRLAWDEVFGESSNLFRSIRTE